MNAKKLKSLRKHIREQFAHLPERVLDAGTPHPALVPNLHAPLNLDGTPRVVAFPIPAAAKNLPETQRGLYRNIKRFLRKAA